MSAREIPAELRERPQWVLWRFEERDGKRTKVPYRADQPQVRASSTDPATWSDFHAVRAHGEEADGVGFVFSEGDDVVGVDLDNCFTDGKLHPEAARVALELDSYAERSVSGTACTCSCTGTSTARAGAVLDRGEAASRSTTARGSSS